jgi:3-deoxy-D-manno-octulosonic-acid transferase
MPGGAALSKFILAKNLVFCRYDFFPEWVSLATHRQSFLLSAVLTEKKRGGFLKGLFLRWLLSRFSKIYAASGEDADRITELGLTSEVCVADFRFEQIFNRQLVANETLEGSDLLGPYLTSLEQVPKEQRLIFGSAHPQDLSALLGESLKKFLDSGGHLYVAPHHLDTNRVDNLVEQFKDFFGPEVIVCSNDWDGKGSLHGKVFVGTFKGVLCEMYPRFSKAYVGGGFLKSVHSVSEAFMGECLVSLGPVHHRSSEYRFIKKVYPERITVLHHEKDLSSWLGRDSLEYTYSYPWQEQMSSLVDQNKALRSDLVKRLQLTQ